MKSFINLNENPMKFKNYLIVQMYEGVYEKDYDLQGRENR